MKPTTIANDMSAFFPSLADAPVAHQGIYAANDDNFDAEHLSEPLTDYIVGVPDEANLEELLEAIAPAIPVGGRSFTYREHDSREDFQDDAGDNGDIREIGGDFPILRTTGTQKDGRTDNKGLIMCLDNDQGGENPSIQRRAVFNLRQRLLRTEVIRARDLIDANANNTNKNWGPAATKPDPEVDILEMVDRGGDARGIDSTLVVMGGGARIKRARSLRASETPGGYASSSLTPEQMAAFYGVGRVAVAKFRRQVSNTAKGKIFSDVVYSYYAESGLMADDPSNIKRFTTETVGGRFRVYLWTKLKRTFVAVEHYSRIILTSPIGIEKLSVTYT